MERDKIMSWEHIQSINVFEKEPGDPNGCLYIASREGLHENGNMLGSGPLRYPICYCHEKKIVEKMPDGKEKISLGFHFHTLASQGQDGDEWESFFEEMAKAILTTMKETRDLSGIRFTYEWEKDHPVHTYITKALGGRDLIV